jgi:protein-tyrosine phosphatase
MKAIPFVMALFSSVTLLAQQFLPVEGIVNARDLGGYEGLQVKKGQLLRAAHLANATPKDLAYLEKLGVATVVDFRKLDEKPGQYDKAVPGATYVALPIDASGSVGASATEKEKKKYMGKKKFNVKKVILLAAFNEKAQVVARQLYPNILFDPKAQKEMAAFLRLVVERGDKPILFHCTQGKDRTGIASALLLAALGADREIIVEDFDVTNKVYAKDVSRYSRIVKFLGGKEEEIGVVKAFMGCNTENFVKALDTIEERYGSLEGYLKGPMGLTDEDLALLRARYLIKN